MSQPFSSSELHLIKKEIETLGEIVNQERLERIAELDQLSLEFKALRKALSHLLSQNETLEEAYTQAYDDLRLSG